MSASLLYKIESLKESIEPLASDLAQNKELIVKLFEYEVAHSGFKSSAHEMAGDLAGLCIKVKFENGKMYAADNWFNPESAIIANFMAQKNKVGGKGND